MPEWTEDSFPGILMNVAVGRIANRFNLGGPNYAIDAACGSSLAAVYACVRELQVGTSDVAIALGADTVQTPYAYMAFSKTHALSPSAAAAAHSTRPPSGIVLSEGVGAVDPQAFGRCRAATETASMGSSRGWGPPATAATRARAAPGLEEGQLRALREGLRSRPASPPGVSVGLIEAHGTGTVVGDQTEAQGAMGPAHAARAQAAASQLRVQWGRSSP